MQKHIHRSIDELLDAYRGYLLSKVSKVRILGEADERELKDVFVELSIVEQRTMQQHAEFLGMMDSTMRRRFNPYADEDIGTSEHREKETKRYVKPDELLRKRTKAIVTGAPGCGKTTLLRYLALQALEKEKRLVVWLELKAIDKLLFGQAEKAAARDGNLILQELWLKHVKSQVSLSNAETNLLREHWQDKFKANDIVALLDGFDEIQDEEIESSLNKCVRAFASAAHNNTLLISTRPYAQHKLGNERLQELEIEPLNQRQIEAFLNHYYPNDAATKSLLKTLRERWSLSELLHVPLLLGLILQLHRENRFTDERLKLYETIVADLVNELDRSKSVIRPFKINDRRLRLDFLKFLAFERLLRDPLDAEEQETSRTVFSYDLLKQKARAFLAQERLPHISRDLADDVLATPLLREVGTDTLAFTHLTLQEYLSARAFAAFHKINEFEGLKIFCRAYSNPTVVELEVLPMMLSTMANADKLYAEIERWPESLTFVNFRLRLRGLVYGARISGERISKITNRVLEFITERKPEESAYRMLIVRSLIGIKGRYADTVIRLVASLLEANNRNVRSQAAEALGHMGNETVVKDLIKAFNDEAFGDEAFYVQDSVATALGLIGSDLAVGDLMSALSEDDMRQVYAQYALSLIGSDKVVDGLIEALSNKNSEVRWRAASTLGELGDERAVDGLIKALSDEADMVRGDAAIALARIGSEKAVDDLIKALNDKDRDMQGAVTYALAKIGNEKAVGALHKALRDEDNDVRQAAVEALRAIGDENAIDTLITVLSDRDRDMRWRAAHELGNIRSNKAVAPLIKALDDKDSDVRMGVAEALGKIGNEKAIDNLIGALSDEVSDVRSHAAEALGKIGSEKAVDDLIKALSDKDGFVRGHVAEALGKIGDERAVEDVMKALSDEDKSVRANAVEALGEIGNDKAVDVLIKSLNDKDSFVRQRAIGALGMLGSDKAVDDLSKVLSDEAFDKRQDVASALGKIGSEKAAAYLIKMLGDKQRAVRDSAAKELGNISEINLSRALERSLASESDFVRCKAAQTIGYYLLEPRLLEELSHIAANDPVEDIRIAAAEAKEKFARKMELLGNFSTEGMTQPLSDNESRELFLVGEAFKIVAEAGHIFRPTPNSDWGIDGEIEFKNERGEASGRRVYLQLKSGDSYLRTRKGDGKEIFTIKNLRHREYWQSQAYPVLLVIRDSGGKIRWMNVSEYLRYHRTNIQQIEFQGEPFTAESVKQMNTIFAH